MPKGSTWLKTLQRVQGQREGGQLRGYWSNRASEDDGLNGVALVEVEVEGSRGGEVILRMVEPQNY